MKVVTALSYGFMGMGSLALHPGRAATWEVAPVKGEFGADRLLITIEGNRDFTVALLGWSVGPLGTPMGRDRVEDLFRPSFSRGSGALWLHPSRGPVRLNPDRSLIIEVENVGPRSVLAKGGVLGTFQRERPR